MYVPLTIDTQITNKHVPVTNHLYFKYRKQQINTHMTLRHISFLKSSSINDKYYLTSPFELSSNIQVISSYGNAWENIEVLLKMLFVKSCMLKLLHIFFITFWNAQNLIFSSRIKSLNSFWAPILARAFEKVTTMFKVSKRYPSTVIMLFLYKMIFSLK